MPKWIFNNVLCFFLLLISNLTYSQIWSKISACLVDSDTLAIYRWDDKNRYHLAYGELVLLKSNRFIYNSAKPFNDQEYTEGFYIFAKDTLILNSDFQDGNLKVRIDYTNTPKDINTSRRLSFAYNSNGIKLSTAKYFLNYDTSKNGIYYADFPLNSYRPDFLNNISSLKLEVIPGISSAWIPILNNKMFINVTVLSDKNFDKYKPKVITNCRFLSHANTLISLDKSF